MREKWELVEKLPCDGVKIDTRRSIAGGEERSQGKIKWWVIQLQR
jgi:hypothetical protein